LPTYWPVDFHALRPQVTDTVQECQESAVRECRCHRGLKTVKVGVEQGEIEIHPVIEQAALQADLVVFGRLVRHWHLCSRAGVESAHKIVGLAFVTR
jgi:hypothetical protein